MPTIELGDTMEEEPALDAEPLRSATRAASCARILSLADSAPPSAAVVGVGAAVLTAVGTEVTMLVGVAGGSGVALVVSTSGSTHTVCFVSELWK